MLGSRMHQQSVTSCVHGRTVLTRIFSGKVHVIMVAYIAHDLAAQQTTAPFVTVAHLLEQLGDSPGFELCFCCGWLVGLRSKRSNKDSVVNGIKNDVRVRFGAIQQMDDIAQLFVFDDELLKALVGWFGGGVVSPDGKWCCCALLTSTQHRATYIHTHIFIHIHERKITYNRVT